jgi:hypothetical protein
MQCNVMLQIYFDLYILLALIAEILTALESLRLSIIIETAMRMQMNARLTYATVK